MIESIIPFWLSFHTAPTSTDEDVVSHGTRIVEKVFTHLQQQSVEQFTSTTTSAW